jgi:hypothetical protein
MTRVRRVRDHQGDAPTPVVLTRRLHRRLCLAGSVLSVSGLVSECPGDSGESTGKSFVLKGIVIWGITNGRICERWATLSVGSWHQLGAA